MVVDASAILAILKGEPEEEAFKAALADADNRYMSPVNWLEVAMKAESAGKEDAAAFRRLADFATLNIVPVDEAQMRIAHAAWRRFGKGRDPARLNLGDCFAYALAKFLDEPLLYKGNDFVHTDITSALP
ncbi:MAG TPA: type II toxin-antitoxin system VapC family toxin [Rhizomicrobium sp.]|nr:type II toxin-antitoxin system VapC family toxin [Rhizomicrobium sp.]